MAANFAEVVRSTVEALGFELVDVERASHGMLRIFIDRRGPESGRLTVDDCATVSNQLTRVFMVESLEYERLEVSSPGLDRPLKTSGDFGRYVGRLAKVRLFEKIDGRKRFEGVIDSVVEPTVTFLLQDGDGEAPLRRGAKSKASRAPDAVPPKSIAVSIEHIERARLVPDIQIAKRG